MSSIYHFGRKYYFHIAAFPHLITIGISGHQEASEMFETIKKGAYKYDTKSKRKDTL